MKYQITMFTINGMLKNIRITKLSKSSIAQAIIKTINNIRTTDKIVLISISLCLTIAIHNVDHKKKKKRVRTIGKHSIRILSDKSYKPCFV